MKVLGFFFDSQRPQIQILKKKGERDIYKADTITIEFGFSIDQKSNVFFFYFE